MNRLLGPESVRHMSVTTATQRPTAAHHETPRHKNKKARETGKTQLTGHTRRWWQVLGSNQRRLSRRFYREPAGDRVDASYLRGRHRGVDGLRLNHSSATEHYPCSAVSGCFRFPEVGLSPGISAVDHPAAQPEEALPRTHRGPPRSYRTSAPP